MSKFVFKLNRTGVRLLMKSEEMQNILLEHGQRIQLKCGTGYQKDIYVGRTRANVMVSAKTYQAKADNLKNNTILKAVGAK